MARSVAYVGGNVVQYITSTLPGSSGSPVFNDSWEVVALHHAGGDIPEPTTQQRYFRNEGILVQSILADLPSQLVWSQLSWNLPNNIKILNPHLPFP